jgi:hypothetical protein
VIFWQCNNALTGHADRFAREMRLDPKQVREELIAGLNPGVKLGPRSHLGALPRVVARLHARTDRLGGQLTRSGMAVRARAKQSFMIRCQTGNGRRKAVPR